MFEAWGRVVYRRRRLVLVIAAFGAIVAAVWGTGVFGALQSAGGFSDPGSQSQQAANLAARAFGRDSGDVVVLYSSPAQIVTSPAVRSALTHTLAALPHSRVASYETYWSTRSPQFVSANGRETFAVLELAGASDTARQDNYDAIKGQLNAPGLRTQVGGLVPTSEAINKQVSSDIGRAEGFAMPVLLVLMLVIFGGLAAASLPLAIGGLAILGSFTALRLLTLATPVSIYSVNITTILGLGLGIDYGLFMVGRFREELRGQGSVEDAVARTVATAGRTVAVSGITVAMALASLMLFPETFLRSMGYGGVATVLVDLLAALTVMPALLAVLGPKVNALRIRRLPAATSATAGTSARPTATAGLAARGVGSGGPGGSSPRTNSAGWPGPSGRLGGSRGVAPPDETGGWYRLARSVMRRPVAYVAAIVIVLLALGSPFLKVVWGGTDATVLPASATPRVVTEALNRDFPGHPTAPIEAVVQFRGPVAGSPARGAALTSYVHRLGRVPGVSAAQLTGVRGAVARVDMRYGAGPYSSGARAIAGQVRDVTPPAGARVYVGGQTAQLVDELSSLGRTLPWMALVVAAATFVLLFLAFGSLVLPVKAIVMSALSLSAMYGVVVWIFQEGHLSRLLRFTPNGTIDPTMPILMFAIMFGLSMDYEVFLLSRIRERYDVTGDNTGSVAAGLQRTGGIITSLALLLIIVVGAFSASGITFIKLMGVGMIVALIIDATVVRVLLVPATMRLLGRANWWLPRPLRPVYARYGIRESDPQPGLVPEPAGTSAGT
jgi:trehalose monomycolate/heme transporter